MRIYDMSTVELFEIPQVVQVSATGLSSHAVVNRTDFNLFKGVDNSIDFVVKNSDRRLENLGDKSYSIVIVDVQLGKVILEKDLVVINALRGHCRLTVSMTEMMNVDYGYLRYSILVHNKGTKSLVFTDQHRGYFGWLEVFDGAIPPPMPPQVLTIEEDFMHVKKGIPHLDYMVSNPIKGNAQLATGCSRTTMQIILDKFEGDILIEASLCNNVPYGDKEWFTLETIKTKKEDTTKVLTYKGWYMWFRVSYQIACDKTGGIVKVVVKT